MKHKFPQEEGIRRRYLFEMDRIRLQYDLTKDQYAQKIGYKNGSNFTKLLTGDRLISLEIIMETFYAFPNDFRLMYVLTSPDMPEITITNMQYTPGKTRGKDLKKRNVKGYMDRTLKRDATGGRFAPKNDKNTPPE